MTTPTPPAGQPPVTHRIDDRPVEYSDQAWVWCIDSAGAPSHWFNAVEGSPYSDEVYWCHSPERPTHDPRETATPSPTVPAWAQDAEDEYIRAVLDPKYSPQQVSLAAIILKHAPAVPAPTDSLREIVRKAVHEHEHGNYTLDDAIDEITRSLAPTAAPTSGDLARLCERLAKLIDAHMEVAANAQGISIVTHGFENEERVNIKELSLRTLEAITDALTHLREMGRVVAERDALKQQLAREQLQSFDIKALKAERDALKAEVERLEQLHVVNGTHKANLNEVITALRDQLATAEETLGHNEREMALQEAALALARANADADALAGALEWAMKQLDYEDQLEAERSEPADGIFHRDSNGYKNAKQAAQRHAARKKEGATPASAADAETSLTPSFPSPN